MVHQRREQSTAVGLFLAVGVSPLELADAVGIGEQIVGVGVDVGTGVGVAVGCAVGVGVGCAVGVGVGDGTVIESSILLVIVGFALDSANSALEGRL